MDGITLDVAELAYLLAVVDARSLAGVDDPRLFPATPDEQDAIFSAGLKALKEHGHLKPAERGSMRLDDGLIYLVSVLAQPEHVILTLRDRDGARQVVFHYLAGPAVIELSAQSNEHYRVGMLPDLAAMTTRIAEMLSVSPAKQPEPATFTIGGPLFGAIKGLIAEGKADQAASTLKSFGVNGLNGDALLEALRAPDTSGNVIVAKVVNGQIEDGRRASVLGRAGRAWLVNRVDAETTAVRVQAIAPGILTEVMDEFFSALQAPGKTA